MATPVKSARLRPGGVPSVFVNENNASEIPGAAFLKRPEDEILGPLLSKDSSMGHPPRQSDFSEMDHDEMAAESVHQAAQSPACELDEVPVKSVQVCERHFRESDILTSSKYVDSKTGKVVEAKLKIARLSSDAVPSVFPNCPAYLSAPAATSREAPAEKRMRLEAASLREAIANSLETHEEEETKHKFDTFQALLECLPQMKLSNFWSVISRPACIHFLNLALEDAPRVLLSITVLEDLTVKVHCQDVQLTTIDGIGAIPHKVNDIRCLTRLLDSVESLHGELSCEETARLPLGFGLKPMGEFEDLKTSTMSVRAVDCRISLQLCQSGRRERQNDHACCTTPRALATSTPPVFSSTNHDLSAPDSTHLVLFGTSTQGGRNVARKSPVVFHYEDALMSTGVRTVVFKSEVRSAR
ncbi:hypothetical protein MRX96_058715 [Rhipicephalus microplus]